MRDCVREGEGGLLYWDEELVGTRRRASWRFLSGELEGLMRSSLKRVWKMGAEERMDLSLLSWQAVRKCICPFSLLHYSHMGRAAASSRRGSGCRSVCLY